MRSAKWPLSIYPGSVSIPIKTLREGFRCRRPRKITQLAEIAKRTGEETLNLVGQTAQAIKLAEDHGQALADQAQERAQRSVNELKIAEARIQSLEEQLRHAEARARESENALQRVHNEIVRTLADHPLPVPLSNVPSQAA